MSLGSDGSFTYDPGTNFDSLAAGATATDSFIYSVTDGTATSTATVTVTLTGENDAPVATPNTYTDTENGTITGNVITDDTGAGTDSDAEGDPLSIAGGAQTLTSTSGGSVSLGSDGSFTYDPGTNFDSLVAGATATDSFIYGVTDGTLSDTATVTVTLTGENDAPVATPNTYTDTENGAVTGNVITDDTGAGTDSDAEGDPLSIAGGAQTLTSTSGGSVSLGSDGSFTYDPGTNFDSLAAGATATDSFVYTVTDGTLTDTATVTITVTGENDAPVATPNTYADTENGTVTGNVITDDTGAGTDSDAEGDPLSIAGGAQTLTSTSGGAVSLGSDGSFTYDPGTNFDSLAAGATATDSFIYSVTDGTATSTATVTVTLTGENDAPVATPNTYTDTENGTVTGNVITDDTGAGTDSDTEGDPLSIAGGAQTLTSTSGGAVSLGSDGSFTYDPGTNFDSLVAGATATDSFVYTVTDGTLTDTATVTITVTGENDAPVATPNTYTDTENGTVTGNVITDDTGAGTDSDTEGDPLSIAGGAQTLTSTSGGAVSLGSDGSFTYDPGTNFDSLAAGATATDSFIYSVTDGTLTDTATVTVTLTGENDAPVATPNTYTDTENGTVTGNVITDDTGAGTDSDTEGDPLSIAGGAQTLTSTSGGAVSLGSDGSFTYDPGTNFDSLAAGATATDSFIYSVTDGTATSTATVTVTLTGENDAPVATPNTYTDTENGTITGNVITDDTGAGTDSDAEGDPLSIAGGAQTLTSTSGGSVSLGSDGSFTYDPGTNFDSLVAGATATDSFIYGVTDGTLSDTATVTVTLTGENDAPVATPNTYTDTENGAVTGNVITDDTGAGTDSDAEGDPLSIAGGAQTLTSTSGGSVSLGSDGSFTYDPGTNFDSLAAGATATDSFVYTVTDGTLTDTATVTITVTGENDAPVATDNSYTTTENGTVTGNAITDDTGAGTDSDAEGDPLSIAGGAQTLTSTSGGSVSLGSDGSFTYDPGTNFDSLAAGATATDSFIYGVTDGTATSTATVTMTLTGENDAPIATPNTYTDTENGTIIGNVITDDTGAESDSDIDSDPLSIVGGAQTLLATGGGLVSLASDGAFTYDPGTNYDFLAAGITAIDTFTYTITDGTLTDSATVTIVINGENDAPTARDNAYSATEDDANISGNVITDNTGGGADSDVDVGSNISIPVTGLTVTTSNGVTLTLGSDGSFTYALDTSANTTLTATESFTDSFTYTVTDGSLTDTATVTFTVSGLNDAPLPTANAYGVSEDGSVSGNVITDDTGAGSDTDPEGDALSIPASATTVTSANGVTITLGTDGTFTYTPGTVFNTLSSTEIAVDSFVYTVSDGSATATQTVFITVIGEADVGNNPPVATENFYTATEDDTSISGNIITDDTGAGVDSDVDAGSSLSIPATGLTVTTSNGVTLTLGSDGSFTYPLDTTANNTMSATNSFTDSFVYTVTDGTLTDTATVTITVTGQNDAPVATANAYTATEDDASVSGNVITDDTGAGVDSDVDVGNSLSIPATGLTVTTSNGVTLTLGSDGSFTYPLDTTTNNTMGPTDSFTDSFVYTVTDGTLTDTALVSFTITGINDAPIAVANTYTATEDLGFNFTQNVITDNTGEGVDSDPESDPISINGGGASGTTSQGGTFCLQSDGVAVYSPSGGPFQTLADGQTATDTFTYTITDGALTDSAVVTVNITGLNDAPEATDNSYTATEDDSSVSGNIITDDTGAGADSDVDAGSSLSIPATGLTVTTSNGVTLTLGSNGSFTYPLDSGTNQTMSATDSFTDSFAYTVADGTLTDTATVTITVTGENDAPIATANVYTATEDDVSISGNIITDDTGAGADSDVDAGSSLSVPATGLTVTTSLGVTLTLGSNGSFTYPLDSSTNQTMTATDSFTDSFTYTVTDGTLTDTATVSFTITGVNDAPVATDNAYATTENATVGGNVITDDSGSGVDSDIDSGATLAINGGAQTLAAVGGGIVSLGSNGSFTYDPGTNYDSLAAGITATDTFTYTVTDGTLTDTATVTITVTGENDAPVATNNAYTATEDDSSVSGNIITDDTGAGADSDVDAGSSLSIPVTGLTVTTSLGVTLTLGSNGSFTYPLDSSTNQTMSATDSFTDSFAYTVTDGTLTDTATVTFTISGVNDAPVATDNAYATTENSTVGGNVITDDSGSGVDSDIDSGATLAINGGAQTLAAVGGGIVSLGSNGSFTYDPGTNFDSLAAGATATDTFTYTVTDGTLTDTATVTITVTGENDAPVATANTYTATEDDASISGNIITDDTGAGADSDVDAGSSLSIPATGLTVTTSLGVTLTLGGNGSFTYPLDSSTNQTMTATDSFTDSFAYTVTDGTLTDTATVSFTITGVNDAPVATDNAYATTENATVGGNVITDGSGSGVDSDIDAGATLAISGGAQTLTAVGGGIVSLASDGTFTYDPGTNYDSLATGVTSTETFTYTVTDGTLTDTATVTITITGENDAPVAQDDNFTIAGDQINFGAELITADNGNGFDTDIDVGDVLSIGNTGTVLSALGVTVTLANAFLKGFAYAANFDSLTEGATIQDTFAYTVTDGTLSDTALVTITFTGDNDSPIATNNTYTLVDENGTISGNVITDNTGANTDRDPENDPISIVGGTQTITATGGGIVSLASDGAFTYDPGTNFDSLAAGSSDTATFIYTITDGTLTDTALVTITVLGVNDAPVATDNAYATTENATVGGNVITDDSGSGVDSDIDAGATLAISGGAQTLVAAGGGIVSLGSDGSFTYDPGTNYDSLATGATATDSFTYTVTDGTLTDTATVTVTLTGENDAPVATPNTYTDTENGTVTGNVITDDTGAGTDSDAEGDPLSIAGGAQTLTSTSGGAVSLGSDGSFTYDPGTNFDSLAAGATATDSFIYSVTDGTATSTATVTVTLAGENDAPEATNNAYAATEDDTSVSGNIITDDTGAGTDSDVDAGSSLSIPVTGLTVTTSLGVTLTLGSNGSFTYPLDSSTNQTMSATDSFTDSFAYTVTDGTLTDTATVTFTISGVNDAPVATDNAYATTENSTVGGNVITDDSGSGVDSDIDSGATLAINGGAQTLAAVGGGIVSLGSNGSFTYDPGTNFDSLAAGATATDTFTYTVTDGTLTDTATVTITVTGENDAPVATANTYTATEDDASISGNIITDDTGAGADSDVDAGSSLSIPATGLTVTTSLGVTLTLGGNGSFTYPLDSSTNQTMTATDSFTDSFAYTVTDGTLTDTATVSFTITGVNDAPVATDNAYATTENATVGGNVITDGSGSGVDSDIDAGATLAISGGAQTLAAVGGGIVSLASNGDFTYDPGTNYDSLAAGVTGTDTFVYTITDGTLTGTATVTITVTGENDAPVATNNAYTATEDDASISGNIITDDTGAGADSDVDAGSSLSIPATGLTVTTSLGVTLTLGGNGSFTYPLDSSTNQTMTATDSFTDSFAYTVTDGTLADTATVTFTITGANDAPVATDDTYTTTENATISGNVITDDTGAGIDSDVDAGATLAISGGAQTLTAVGGGIVSLASDGSFTYDPGTNYDSLATGVTSTETFTYTVTDGTLTDTATVTITITGENDAPVAQDDDFTIAGDQINFGAELITADNGNGFDTDIDVGDVLSIGNTGTVLSALGVTVTLANAFLKGFAYAANFDSLTEGATIQDTFAYTVTDGTLSDTALVTITFTGDNDSPIATNNTYILVDENGTISGNVMTDNTGANTDRDPENDPISIVGGTQTLTATGGGIVSLASDGAFTYDPGTNFDSLAAGSSDTATFIYTITDGTLTDTALVTITVLGVNDAPVATDNAYATTENATVGGNVITDDSGSGTDSDVDTGATLAINGGAQTLTATGGGIVSLGSDGSFTYDPGTNYDSLSSGQTDTDSFVYTVTDGTLTDTATVTITITGEALDQINEIGIANAQTPEGVINEDFIELHNSMTDAAQDLSGLEIQITGVTVGSTTSFIIPEGIATPAAGFFTIYGNGEYALYDSNGTLTEQGFIPSVSWDFADTNGDGFVDTRDAIGVNFKVVDSMAVIDTFVANGASFAEQKWNPIAMPVLASLGGVLVDGFNAQIGDQQSLLNSLGIVRPSVSGASIAPEASGSTFAKHTDVPGADNPSNQTAWNTTDTATPGDFNNSSSLNPLDANDDLNPGQANTDPLAGQNIIEVDGVNNPNNQAVIAGHGNDFIIGDSRDNILYGGANNDFISGGAGDDQLYGEGGADLLFDNQGSDYLVGGSGDDTLLATASAFNGSDPAGANATDRDVIVGDAAVDGIVPDSDNIHGSDVIYGSNYNDIIFGDSLYIDFVALAAVSGNLNADDLREAYADSPVQFVHDYLSSDSFNASIDSLGADDWIDAGDGDDIINGQGGDDEIIAGAGDDHIDGGSGADDLSGGLGNDVLIFDSLDASIAGNGGTDTLRFNVTSGPLDFANVHPSISDIEVIELSGTGTSILNLTPEDVAAITDSNNTLRITGHGDTVTGSGWGEGIVGETTTIYTDGFNTLILDNSIDQDLLS